MILGFALGQIVERNLFIEALSKHKEQITTPVLTAPAPASTVRLTPGLRC